MTFARCSGWLRCPPSSRWACWQFGLKADRKPPGHLRRNPLRRDALARLGPNYWRVVALGAAFTLARFSEAFLVLRAQQSGIPVALVPLVMVAMSAVYALSAYPLGALSDRTSHRVMLAWGMGVLIVADLVLGLASHWSAVLVGVLLWGLHLGMTQGLLAAMVAATAPAELRGTAFGMFNLASGAALLVSSGTAGLLWDRWGPASPFYAGALCCALALVGLAFCPMDTRQPPTTWR